MASGSGFTNRIQKARFWHTKWIGPGLQQYLGRKHHIWEFQKKTGKENSAKTTIHLGYPTCWKKRQWGELWCQSSMPFKKNEMISVRTYMRIYVYTYIIYNIMYMYIQKKTRCSTLPFWRYALRGTKNAHGSVKLCHFSEPIQSWSWKFTTAYSNLHGVLEKMVFVFLSEKVRKSQLSNVGKNC